MGPGTLGWGLSCWTLAEYSCGSKRAFEDASIHLVLCAFGLIFHVVAEVLQQWTSYHSH